MINEFRAVLAQDLAVLLKMEKKLFCRLISRTTLVPPVVTLISLWPPPLPKSKAVQDLITLFPLRGVGTPATEDSNKEQHSKGCWLGGSLLVSSGKENKTAVALSKTHVMALLEAVEQNLYEETILVDIQALKAFVHAAFGWRDGEPETVPLHVAEAFPDLFTKTGQRKEAAARVKKTSEKSSPKESGVKTKRVDDLTDDWDERLTTTWSGKRRNLRRKTRLQRHVTNHDEKKFDSSDESDEEILPRDSLQLLIDDLIAKAQILFKVASA